MNGPANTNSIVIFSFQKYSNKIITEGIVQVEESDVDLLDQNYNPGSSKASHRPLFLGSTQDPAGKGWGQMRKLVCRKEGERVALHEQVGESPGREQNFVSLWRSLHKR